MLEMLMQMPCVLEITPNFNFPNNNNWQNYTPLRYSKLKYLQYKTVFALMIYSQNILMSIDLLTNASFYPRV